MAHGGCRLIWRSLFSDVEAAMLTDREFALLVCLFVSTDDYGFGECNPAVEPYEAPREKPRDDHEAIELLRAVNQTSMIEIRTDWKPGRPPRRARWLYRCPKFAKAQKLRAERRRDNRSRQAAFAGLLPLERVALEGDSTSDGEGG